MGEPLEQPPAVMLPNHPGFWGEAGGPWEGGAMAVKSRRFRVFNQS